MTVPPKSYEEVSTILDKISEEIVSINRGLDDNDVTPIKKLEIIKESLEKIQNYIIIAKVILKPVTDEEKKKILDCIIRRISYLGIPNLKSIHELKDQDIKTLIDLMG